MKELRRNSKFFFYCLKNAIIELSNQRKVTHMKIKIARYVRVYFYLALIFAVIACAVFYYEIGPLDYYASTEDTLLTIVCIVSPFLLPVFQLMQCPRAFAIVDIEKDWISSSLFGKVKCKIKTDTEVYYTIIEANPEKLIGARGIFIVVSNKFFLYEQRKKIGCGIWKKEKLFENYYDMTQMILIPYNEKTKHIFPLEKWTDCTNGKNR